MVTDLILLPTREHPNQGKHSITKMTHSSVSQPPSSATLMLAHLHNGAKNSHHGGRIRSYAQAQWYGFPFINAAAPEYPTCQGVNLIQSP